MRVLRSGIYATHPIPESTFLQPNLSEPAAAFRRADQEPNAETKNLRGVW
jgi:hypothetical protein